MVAEPADPTDMATMATSPTQSPRNVAVIDPESAGGSRAGAEQYRLAPTSPRDEGDKRLPELEKKIRELEAVIKEFMAASGRQEEGRERQEGRLQEDP